MHILLLTSSYKSEFNTVSALFFRDQALALKNNEMQVGVICPLPISLKSVWQRKSISFNDEIYNFRRIRLAPLIVLSGFILCIFSILYKDKR